MRKIQNKTTVKCPPPIRLAKHVKPEDDMVSKEKESQETPHTTQRSINCYDFGELSDII